MSGDFGSDDSSGASRWRPAADLPTLRRRAELLARIRAFFADRGVLEVETPVLSAATVTDLHLASLSTEADLPATAGGRRRLYLQTSPEFAMKRLLAAGSGPVYQLGRAFRDGEAGRRHNPEFTLLEWYRPGFDHHDLMDEVEELLRTVAGVGGPVERLTYARAFRRHAGIDPHRATAAELERRASELGVDAPGLDARSSADDWLHLILSHVVEPELGNAFLYDFPASQAALARVRPGRRGEPAVAERFELYLRGAEGGVELANGFHELTDADEQRRRFEDDLAARRQAGLPQVPVDERLLAALEHGLPECAGVALGVDRLLQVMEGKNDLRDVMAFPVDRA